MERKVKMWQLDVGIPLRTEGIDIEAINGEDIFILSRQIEAEIGKDAVSAGTGFGFRDMQFDFTTEEIARKAEEKFISIMKQKKIPCNKTFKKKKSAYSSISAFIHDLVTDEIDWETD